jgi:hypothetical protein
MKIWTLAEMRSKVFDDDDLNDESFITADELAGYFNEAVDDAEAEILTLNQDYFLTKYYVPLAVGTAVYDLPKNIYANKIRGIVYKNGSDIYQVKKHRRRNIFETLAVIDNSGSALQYRYILRNDSPGQAKLELTPTSRDAAVYATSTFPMVMWHIRNANRFPVVGEYCNPEIIPTTAVNTTTNVITVNSGTTTYGNLNLGTTGCYPGSITYVTGDKVKVYAGPGGTVPAPLVEGTVYYVIAVTATTIKLATSAANATAGTAIDLTDTGTVFFRIEVAATTAITLAALLDIPEFASYIMQSVKVKAMGKEGDPRGAEETAYLVKIKEQMIATLAESVPDDDNTIEADFSHYEEMS